MVVICKCFGRPETDVKQEDSDHSRTAIKDPDGKARVEEPVVETIKDFYVAKKGELMV